MEREKLSNTEAALKLGLDLVRYTPGRCLDALKKYPLGVIGGTGFIGSALIMTAEEITRQPIVGIHLLFPVMVYSSLPLMFELLIAGFSAGQTEENRRKYPNPGSAEIIRTVWWAGGRGIKNAIHDIGKRWDEYRNIR